MTNMIAFQVVIRAVIQVIAGILVSKGFAKEGAINVEEISGAVLIVGTIIWSYFAKKQLISNTSQPSNPTTNG